MTRILTSQENAKMAELCNASVDGPGKETSSECKEKKKVTDGSPEHVIEALTAALKQDRYVEELRQSVKDRNSAPGSPTKQQQQKTDEGNKCVSLADYFYGEIRRGYMLENDEQRYAERREKFYMFLKIPRELEKFVVYGFFQCADAFLFVFTLLPIRFVLAIWLLFTRSFKLIFSSLLSLHRPGSPGRLLQSAEICDLLKGVILIVVAFLMNYMDTSMLYHIVKSQSVIKLYIIFNMLEVGDKLFSSFGQDILDALMWTATEPRGRKREHLGLLPHLLLAIIYVYVHALLVLLQATTLNVAINSQNKALLTIMMSNNFVELKGMVFKKFEKNNLFQMSCSDVRERFHYLMLLFIVVVQTMKEYNWSEDHFWILVPDCVIVLIAEVLVDWVKHAFITRFNEISHEVYKDYTVSLAYDLASSKLKSAYSDHSDLVSRRMAFIPLPMGALIFRIVSGSITCSGLGGALCLIMFYLCLLSVKVLNNIILLGQACDLIELHRQSIKERLPMPRQCSSLPSSRHHSMEDLREPSLQCTKSVPQSATASVSSSLQDISTQAQLLQETMEKKTIFSNSTVSINSLGLNENLLSGENVFESEHRTLRLRSFSSGVGRTGSKRRISLEEKRTCVEEPSEVQDESKF